MFSLLALIDDVAATLDDVTVMTKVAMKKTSALMSDDLAVNAGVVDGVNPDRELPMVKAIFLGSLINKVYSIVGVLTINAIYPPIIQGVLFIGGLYLAYEGVHKIVEKLFQKKDANETEEKKAVVVDEKEKTKQAIKTDLILSVEIIVIAQNALTGPTLNQVLSLIAVGIGASIIIYGLVAILVKIDDFGLYLIKKGQKGIGMAMVKSMPYLMKGLGIGGTIAMLLVGGGIVSHTFHLPHYAPEMLQNLVLGLVAGLVTLPIAALLGKFFVKEPAK
jgi:predicted DNA repair protein MutK